MNLRKQAEKLSQLILDTLKTDAHPDEIMCLFEAQYNLYKAIAYAPTVKVALDYLDRDEDEPVNHLDQSWMWGKGEN